MVIVKKSNGKTLPVPGCSAIKYAYPTPTVEELWQIGLDERSKEKTTF